MRFNAVLIGAMLVSGCASDGASNAMDNGAGDDSGIDLPRAGLYKITEVSEIFGGAPGMAGPLQSYQSCLPEQTEDTLLTTSGMHCSPEQVRISNGSISATMRCTTPGTAVQDAALDYRGNYDADGAELTGDVVLPQGMIRLTRKLERIGDC